MKDVHGLLTDLADEGAELDALVSSVELEVWRTPTPAPDWTISHQIAHLAWTDRAATLAATDPDTFTAMVRNAERETGGDATGFVDAAAEQGAAVPPAHLLAEWRRGRAELIEALRSAPEDAKLPWFAGPMKVASMATARLMETWAHGQDVADALSAYWRPTGRLRHVAHLGVRTIGFAFVVNGLPAPPHPFRVELTGPCGESWQWGPADAVDRISGPALDFCLLVTQRRHPEDLAIAVVGEYAQRWVPIAQVFAGPPGAGRKPGQRS